MKARYHTRCPACHQDILPGQEIRHAKRIGYVHEADLKKLATHIPEQERDRHFKQIYGNAVRTRRDQLEYDLARERSDDADLYYDPLFGEFEMHNIVDESD